MKHSGSTLNKVYIFSVFIFHNMPLVKLGPEHHPNENIREATEGQQEVDVR